MDISFSTEVESNVDELDEAIARLEQLDGKTAEAGLFDGFAAKKATWQEYGTSRGIPARPFLRNTQYENENQWSQKTGQDIIQVFEGGLSSSAVLSKLGILMVQDIRKTIDTGNFAPLSPATIAKKGSSKPLVDTGDMYGAITHRES
ncbi:hypothetical protein [Weissella paramesenteroides]|uniref:hypothetical protein n=1 Tax=Weissella paramesenteroides TaxID=1249 RepID=UPI0020744691|nr:hypothetical protein [Weissella paramesenteroides]MCM6765680.1 hypothetical protein [Weissella paramesenteroides]MCM6767037.1 hypothetical protein [Weissella paramesenteroides]MCM6771185.1 hypothetical protein [Weissella paramesenteroides]MCM6779722.1 hypothetical protein [Weissella paramesenteroides]MCM6781738.1 hypothetical protein [Weissella paramesenteroides]